MTTVSRGAPFPALAVMLGVIGTAALALGVTGLIAPQALPAMPLVHEVPVATAMVVSGCVLMVVEAVLVLAWVRRRAAAARDGRT